jgi:ABC-type multidrug transport system ATPase subunit
MSASPPPPAPAAAFAGVTVRYGRSVAADAVTFDVAAGQVYALLGRNGAGKSSLVRCLLGMQKPSAGAALLFGTDAWRTRAANAARAGAGARAGPELLVLDDPTLGFDEIARRELWEELVGELAERGVTMLLTTHDLAGVEGIANRVGILVGGRLAVDEPITPAARVFVSGDGAFAVWDQGKQELRLVPETAWR